MGGLLLLGVNGFDVYEPFTRLEALLLAKLQKVVHNGNDVRHSKRNHADRHERGQPALSRHRTKRRTGAGDAIVSAVSSLPFTKYFRELTGLESCCAALLHPEKGA